MQPVRAVEHAAWHAYGAPEVLMRLESSEQGLTSTDADARLERHGPNALPPPAGNQVLRVLVRQVNDPIVYLLLGSVGVAIAVGKVLDGFIVLAAVVINLLIGLIQELRASKAIEALSRMVSHDTTVLRDGRLRTVPVVELVPGDVVRLAAGDRVPADLRLLSAHNLRVEEAALTGESVPAMKQIAPVDADAPIGDRTSMAFCGTLVTAGAGTAVVAATGVATELGRVSTMLEEAEDLETPLTQALGRVGRWLSVLVLVIAAVLLGISLLRGYPFADAVLVAVALAVATIPEGLPAIITIALAIGVRRMAGLRAITRRLPAVETLGSTTVICSDKTGTLTRNEMTVQALWCEGVEYGLTGVGYAPKGELIRDGQRIARPETVGTLLSAAALCNDADLHLGENGPEIAGDPTEGALVVAAEKLGIQVGPLRDAWPRIDAHPFDAADQFMATLHRAPNGGVCLYLKGAPEVVLRRCEAADFRSVMRAVDRMAARGLRVLAVAEKQLPAGQRSLEPADLAGRLRLLGLEGMLDPPREEAIQAVKRCRDAGITVKMITGDHQATAVAIAAQLGLSSDGRSLNGVEIQRLGNEELRVEVKRTNVFARVAPEHKLRLVRALQEEGEVVAMTGDGVNDAPALKQANIGIAMGITGTAAAKEASDIVLTDDNFATIAAAVEEGRRIYDNLVKSLAFVLPTNLGLGIIVAVAVSLFPLSVVDSELLPLMPMLPAQILWVNLVAAVTLSLPLAFEVAERDVMQRPPRAPGHPILGRFVLWRTLVAAVLMSAGAVGLFLWEYQRELPRIGSAFALREAQTMAVTTVVAFQAFYLLSCRSLRESVFKIGFFSNPTIFAGIGILALFQAAFIYVPFLQEIFRTAPLDWKAVALSILIGAVILPVTTLEKAVRSWRSARRRRKRHPRPAPTGLPT